MFDSPIAQCSVCRQWVLLDQTQKECAREHGCAQVRCPLEKYFTGFDFGTVDCAEPTKPAPR